MINKKNITKIYYLFLSLHLVLWTTIPFVSNVNLPLDTIEALAWGSDLDWGFSKHPPFSAFAVEIFYFIFGSQDWAYYLLSQIFVIISFIYVWKLSQEIFQEKIYALVSLLALESIFYFNYTTPEFNVNVSQLPFWALTVFYFWKSIQSNKIQHWLLFGIFSALGFLSKYLFIYILFATFLFLFLDLKKNKIFLKNYFLSILTSFIIVLPHLIWLFENNFTTINYGLNRSSLISVEVIDYLLNPLTFIFKQFFILIPFFLLFLILFKNLKLRIDYKNKKTFFLISICVLPLLLMLLTSIITGAKIRTMWMTPFYLFFGTLFVQIFKKNIDLKKIKKFYIAIIVFFFISPAIYFTISIYDKTKRTDYPGKEISRLVQNKWDENFINEIKIVVGDEWSAGNLSYHLNSRPVWINNLDKEKATSITDEQGIIYTGNPKILKKICPGVFGTIRPVGYCMIGKR